MQFMMTKERIDLLQTLSLEDILFQSVSTMDIQWNLSQSCAKPDKEGE